MKHYMTINWIKKKKDNTINLDEIQKVAGRICTVGLQMGVAVSTMVDNILPE